jgi:hypothetical protein
MCSVHKKVQKDLAWSSSSATRCRTLNESLVASRFRALSTAQARVC